MSTVVRDLQRARTAYGKPTLRLLNQRNAPFILAIFSTLLPAEQTRLPAEQFHLKVSTCLELLREHDPAAPDEPARQLCRDWVKSQWLWVSRPDIGHLRERMHDPADQVPPAPLATPTGIVDADLWEQARQQGGPNLPELRRQVAAAASSPASPTAAEVFNALPEQLRRPVEVLGLLHAAADRDAPYRPQQQTQEYLTKRPDGTTRTFNGPLLPLSHCQPDPRQSDVTAGTGGAPDEHGEQP